MHCALSLYALQCTSVRSSTDLLLYSWGACTEKSYKNLIRVWNNPCINSRKAQSLYLSSYCSGLFSTYGSKDAWPRQPIVLQPIWVIGARMQWESMMYLINCSIMPWLMARCYRWLGRQPFNRVWLISAPGGNCYRPLPSRGLTLWAQREGRNKVLWYHPIWPDSASHSLSSFYRDNLSQFLSRGLEDLRWWLCCFLTQSLFFFFSFKI